MPEESSFMCSVRVDDLDGLYRQIKETGVVEKTAGRPRLHPVQLQP
ncbi:hypothetical protein LXM50_09795 [Microbacterium sp. Au-Mic1]|nr:hypothetical protein [Microbacterium sp. Au-Mic1]MCE4026262.1 hypothetical protein [Microbacterium sp. Au-Mic1]